ncbi:hypothetical protein BDA96_05G063400 [Sorghum bicolor]|uniref:Uncharacterized protein n=1 Tax=Sorghum bicolor TaxID=4558 RepID=A0A921UFX0_SORBI|nr:hypothetical protein BDA96_05G063400 [Sorghum bicolor]
MMVTGVRCRSTRHRPPHVLPESSPCISPPRAPRAFYVSSSQQATVPGGHARTPPPRRAMSPTPYPTAQHPTSTPLAPTPAPAPRLLRSPAGPARRLAPWPCPSSEDASVATPPPCSCSCPCPPPAARRPSPVARATGAPKKPAPELKQLEKHLLLRDDQDEGSPTSVLTSARAEVFVNSSSASRSSAQSSVAGSYERGIMAMKAARWPRRWTGRMPAHRRRGRERHMFLCIKDQFL